jgi:murein DD-endopeptidase MepM/ murein hydrolase activator NlpD
MVIAMKKRLFAVLLAALVLAPTTSARADDGGGLSAEAIAAASLGELQASDDKLDQAISTLNKEVSNQQLQLSQAQQSAEAADAAVNTNNGKLEELRVRINALQKEATDRAVQEYVRPHDEMLTHVLSSDGLEDASRRTQLLAEVNDRDFSAMEDLRAARSDLEALQKAAQDAQRVAQERRASEQKKLDDLNTALADKAKIEKAVQDRINQYAQESAASAGMPWGASGDRASRGGGSDNDARVSAAGLRWPTTNHQVNSKFGYRWGTLHPGLDLEAKIGTPIYAAKSGRVTYASWMSGYGNYTCIDHGGGFSTCYGHQSSISVSAGQQVNQGDLIGYSGNTGYSTGPHVHFETRVNGKPEDPLQYLP